MSFLRLATLAAAIVWLPVGAHGLDRLFDGSYNHLSEEERGSAGEPLIRINYLTEYLNTNGDMIGDAQRKNPRLISNGLSAQSASIPSARHLSDYIAAWGQFLDHDMSLSTTSAGAGVNGSAPIAVGPGDPLGPNPIAFTRSNFVTIGEREQVNEVSAWIDGSQVYGSSSARAAALRTGGGSGAKLQTSANNLLPYNTGGLANQNQGPTPANQLFLAGDIRANENLMLTSLQTVFMREHNRVVDRIAATQPGLSADQQYYLARKIVGAELQAITYNEFLPTLLGPNAPSAQSYSYQPNVDGSITNSFAHAAFRFGHSTLNTNMLLVNNSGAVTGSLAFNQAHFAPNQITNNPGMIDQVLMGASLQTSQEVDLQLVDSIRNVMFGPPGAGGTDLAAVDIQRGRDHGLPDYNNLRVSYGLSSLTNINQITANVALRQAISATLATNINNIDAFVGILAEDHLAGSSMGALGTAIIKNQFERSRDGDRFFYLGNVNGLYQNGVLRPEIAAIVNLNTVTLSDVIMANTGLTNLAEDVFIAPQTVAGDFNHDGFVNSLDLNAWRASFGAGGMTGADFLTWQRALGAAATVAVSSVPEPGAIALLAMGVVIVGVARRRLRNLAIPPGEALTADR
ncbi:MAG: hypothetical protein H0T51_16870 [Pirellulales bacterium]|nr:hypothetical protein [Pirellulales bacterium]